MSLALPSPPRRGAPISPSVLPPGDQFFPSIASDGGVQFTQTFQVFDALAETQHLAADGLQSYFSRFTFHIRGITHRSKCNAGLPGRQFVFETRLAWIVSHAYCYDLLRARLAALASNRMQTYIRPSEQDLLAQHLLYRLAA